MHDNEGWPIFNETLAARATTLVLTDVSVLVRPAHAAKFLDALAEGGLIASFKRNVEAAVVKSVKAALALERFDVVDYYRAIHQLAESGSYEPTFISEADGEAEFFFNEMVNLEVKPDALTITMRDNRTLVTNAPQSFTAVLQAGVRAAKSGRARSASSDPPADSAGSRTCPMCAETVKAAARICRFCQHRFE